MTFCAGWKYKDTVFLLADTAATKPVKPETTHSSFGELHAEVRGEYVEESLLKLVPIGTHMVAAYAGDVQLATHYLDFLRDSRPTAKSNTGLLNSLASSMGPFSPDRAVALILASSAADGSCELLQWSTTEGLNQSGADYYQIGSLTSYHAALTPALLSQLIAGNLDSARMLAVVTAVVQSYGIHDNLIDMNVGGLIFGLQTCHGAVAWLQDTNYVIYDTTLSTPAFVTAIARDNALIVSSSQNDDTRVFGHSTSMPRRDLWDETWLRKAKESLDSGRSRYWVFISTSGKVITLIVRGDLDKESRYVKLTRLGNGKFDLAISQELMTLLLQPLQGCGDGSLPFRLNVRND
jgi:hypothetical protein